MEAKEGCLIFNWLQSIKMKITYKELLQKTQIFLYLLNKINKLN